MFQEEKTRIRKASLVMLASLAVKTLLYVLGTGVVYSRLAIFLISFGITALIILALEYGGLENKKIFQLIFYLVYSLIIFADVMHYTYFQSLTSVTLFKQVGQVGAIKDSLKALFSLDKVLILIDLPFVVYYVIKNEEELDFINCKYLMAGLGVITTSMFIYLIGIDKLPALKNQEFYSYHVRDIKNMIVQDSKLKKDDIELLKKYLDREEEDGDKKYHAIAKDRNLILIQVEALQNFVINLEYNGQEITPNLNRLIAEQGSIYFDDYFQLVGRGNTSDAEFISNNSLHPSMEEYTYIQYEDNGFYGLPWLLRDEGYRAWVFHGYEKEFWNREKAYKGQGFERFFSEEDFDYEETIGFGISDHEFLDQTLDYLVELNEDSEDAFYSFIITLSSHTPYVMDEKYQFLDIKEEDRDNLVGNYLQAVHYTDKCLGDFIEGLKEEGLYDNSVIALYGDHFGVNNADETVFRPMKDILGMEYNFDHIMNIPLVIHVPGEEINETISKTGSQIDFYPTILNIMGLENEKGFMFGRDLVNFKGENLVKPQTVMRKGSFISEDTMFIFSGDGIFEHSSAIDRKTRKAIDIEPLREQHERVIEEVNVGDMVLKKNILGAKLKNPENFFQDALVGEDNLLKDVDRIEDLTGMKLEEIEEYLAQHKIGSMNLDRTRIHEEDLVEMMKENEDFYLLVRTRSNPRDQKKSKYAKLRNVDRAFMLENRFLTLVDDFDKYYFIKTERFSNLILDVTKGKQDKEEILDFLNINRHLGIVLNRKDLDYNFSKELKDLNVEIFIKKEDDLIKYR